MRKKHSLAPLAGAGELCYNLLWPETNKFFLGDRK